MMAGRDAGPTNHPATSLGSRFHSSRPTGSLPPRTHLDTHAADGVVDERELGIDRAHVRRTPIKVERFVTVRVVVFGGDVLDGLNRARVRAERTLAATVWHWRIGLQREIGEHGHQSHTRPIFAADEEETLSLPAQSSRQSNRLMRDVRHPAVFIDQVGRGNRQGSAAGILEPLRYPERDVVQEGVDLLIMLLIKRSRPVHYRVDNTVGEAYSNADRSRETREKILRLGFDPVE